MSERKSASRLLLWSCNCAMLGVAASANVTPVCLSSISETFALDYAQQGLLLGCTFWGFIIALLIVGPASDRLGPRPFFYLASIMQIGGFALLALAWDVAALVTGTLLIGIGAGALETLLTPVICETFPDRKTSAVNAFHAYYALGAVGVILLARTILKSFEPAMDGEALAVLAGEVSSRGWRWAYASMIPIPIVFGLGYFVCFRIRKVPISYPHSESNSQTLKRLRCWWFAIFIVTMLCAGGTELGAAQWLPSYMENVMAWSRENSAMALLILSLTMGIGRILGSRVANYISAAGMLILAGAMCACCLVVAGTTSSGSVAVAAFGVMGFFVGWLWPTSMAIASEAFPKTGSTMFALLAVFGNGGGIVFPGAMGIIAEKRSLRAAMICLALAPCVVLLVFSVWRIRQRKKGSTAISTLE